MEGFRAYLQEMTDLGVLASNKDGRGWHLRSANVLNMIGTREDVEAQLVTASVAIGPDEIHRAGDRRQELPGGRRSPLDGRSRSMTLLGDHSNQVRVVLGSRATGIEFDERSSPRCRRCSSSPVAGAGRGESAAVRRSSWLQALQGERRVILDDLVNVAPHEASCLEALEGGTDAVAVCPRRDPCSG